MDAIEKIYRLYFTDVYCFMLSLAKNEYIAQEMTSETFFKALQFHDRIKKPEAVKSFLFTTARHAYYDYLKKNKHIIGNLDHLNIADPENNPEEKQIQYEEILAIQKALEKLPQADAELVKMRIYADYSFREIAAFYGKTENWACVKFHRAKQKMKQILEENNENMSID